MVTLFIKTHKPLLMSALYSPSVAAWTPRLEVLTEPNAYEEEEERQDDQYVHHSDSFRHFTPSHSQRAGPSYAHTPRRKDAIYSNLF